MPQLPWTFKVLPCLLALPSWAATIPTCQDGASLASYISLGSTGCLGPKNAIFSNFVFSATGDKPLDASQVQVSPTIPDDTPFGPLNKSTLYGVTLVAPELGFFLPPGKTDTLNFGLTVTTFGAAVPILGDFYYLSAAPVSGGVASISVDGSTPVVRSLTAGKNSELFALNTTGNSTAILFSNVVVSNGLYRIQPAVVILPEPATGVLLSVGLLFSLARKHLRFRIRCKQGHPSAR